MGRWLVILSLAMAQWPNMAAASPKSSDVPLWKRLLSSFTSAPQQPPRERARRPAKAIATAKLHEPVVGPRAHEPIAAPQARQAIAESQAQESAAPKSQAPEPVAGWQAREPIANWPAQEPVAAPQAPQPVTESQAQEPAAKSQAHEPVAGWQAQGPARSNGTACSGGRRIISAFYSQGRRTASGQPFDPKAMTAAHRTLPFGTQLTVTNPRTGKSVTVVVNDRGPYVSGVSLDLTFAAAQAIGMHGTGAVCIW
jgi:rare lipoprotein A